MFKIQVILFSNMFYCLSCSIYSNFFFNGANENNTPTHITQAAWKEASPLIKNSHVMPYMVVRFLWVDNYLETPLTDSPVLALKESFFFFSESVRNRVCKSKALLFLIHVKEQIWTQKKLAVPYSLSFTIFFFFKLMIGLGIFLIDTGWMWFAEHLW